MICENVAQCPFFNDKIDIDKGLGFLFKKKYCEGDKTICARYKIATNLGATYVPKNLFPNMNKQAEDILRENNK